MSVHDVVIRFLVQNMPEVDRAMQSVAQSAARVSRTTRSQTPRRATNAPSAQTDRDEAKRAAVTIAEEHRRATDRGLGMSRPANRIRYPQTRAEARYEGTQEPPRPPKAHAPNAPQTTKEKVLAQIQSDIASKHARPEHEPAEMPQLRPLAKAEDRSHERTPLKAERPSGRDETRVREQITRRITPKQRVEAALEGPPEPTHAQKMAHFEGPPAPTDAQMRSSHRATEKRSEAEAKEKLRAQLRADADLKRLRDREARDVEKRAAAEKRTEDRLALEKVRAAKQVVIEKLRSKRQEDAEMIRTNRWRERENEKLLNEGRRLEERTHREQTRKIEKETAARQDAKETFARGVGQGVVNVAKGVAGGVVGGMQKAVGMVTQLGGGFDVGSSVQRAAENTGQLEDILNSAQNATSPIAANQRRHQAAEVEPEIQGTSVRYGMERKDVQAGLGSIVGITGDLQTSMKLLPQLAEYARATGSSFDHVAQAAGNVGLAFGDMTDSGKKAEKIMQVMRGVAGQGKAGNIEVKDNAVQMAKMVASAGKFEGDNAENILKMGALMQFSRGGGGAWNAASAATAMTAFTGTFGKGARLDAFEDKKIDVFADKEKTMIRPPEQIIADALEKTKGSQPEMTQLFGSVMGMRAVNQFTTTYTKAEREKPGSGRAAVLGTFNDMVQKTMMTKGQVTAAASMRVGALDAQMASAREQFDQAIQTRLVPALLKLVPVIEEMIPTFVDLHAQAMPAFVDLIKTVADFADKNRDIIQDIAAHPIGALIAAEIGKAALPAILEKAIGGPFTSLATTTLAAAGPMATLGAAVVAAAAAIYGAKKMIDAEFGKEKEANDTQLGHQMEATNLASKLRQGGTLSPDDAAKAQKLITDMQGDVKQQVDLRENPGIAKTASAAMANIIAPEAAKEAADSEEHARQDAIRGLNDSIKMLQQALEKNTTATETNSKLPSGGGGAPPTPAGRPASASAGIVQRTTP
jgi:hypothetical protein